MNITNFKKVNILHFLEDAKKQILKFWTIIKGKHAQSLGFVVKVKQILYKDIKLKQELEKNLNIKLDNNAELGSFVDINSETINLSEYK
jgi:hypothetical protein